MIEYTRLTNNVNGVITLSGNIKIVYGVYPADHMTHDANRGAYISNIDLTSYGFTGYMFAQATSRYPSGMPKSVVFSVTSSTLSIGCDVNVADCYVQWMVIGSV